MFYSICQFNLYFLFFSLQIFECLFSWYKPCSSLVPLRLISGSLRAFMLFPFTLLLLYHFLQHTVVLWLSCVIDTGGWRGDIQPTSTSETGIFSKIFLLSHRLNQTECSSINSIQLWLCVDLCIHNLQSYLQQYLYLHLNNSHFKCLEKGSKPAFHRDAYRIMLVVFFCTYIYKQYKLRLGVPEYYVRRGCTSCETPGLQTEL